MPAKLIKATEAIQVKAVCCLIFGTPGSRKTSCAQTCNNPLTLDFDKGVHRAFGRKDTVQFDTWDDVLTALGPKQNLSEGYDTIVVDTLGRLLDLMSIAIAQNAKNGNRTGGLSQQGWGVLKSQFSFWISALRASGKDVVLICHEKIDKDGDQSYARPDISGGSYGEVMKSADLIGYSHYLDSRHVLNFNPSDAWMAKGPSGWAPFQLPDFGQNKTFMADMLTQAKATMGQLASESAEAAKLVDEWRMGIETYSQADQFNEGLSGYYDLNNKAVKTQVWKLMLDQAKKHSIEWDAKAKSFKDKQGAAA